MTARTLLACLGAALCLAIPVQAYMTGDALREHILATLASQPLRGFHFVQEKKLAILSKPLISEGELRFSQNQTVIWDIHQPYALRYELSHEQVRESGPQGERVLPIGQNPVAAALAQVMAATFSGQWQHSGHLASVTATGEPGKWQLQITPHSEELQALVSSIVVNGHEGLIERIVITEKNGDTATIRLVPLAQ